MRNFLRAVWSQLIRIAPPWLAYRLRYLKELLVFRSEKVGIAGETHCRRQVG